MKKYTVFILLLVLIMTTGCIYKSQDRPTNQIPSRWTCTETQIEIYVPEGYQKVQGELGLTPLEPICTMSIDGENIQFNALFDGGRGVTFQLDGERVLKGRCTYGKEHFSIKVTSDTIFNGKYNELYFYKDKEYVPDDSAVEE